MGDSTGPLKPSNRPRVVIVGAGFAGLHAAKGLAHLPVDVTVIDRRNHNTFQPLLYQVALAVLSPADIAQPIRAILRSQEIKNQPQLYPLHAGKSQLLQGRKAVNRVVAGKPHQAFESGKQPISRLSVQRLCTKLPLRRGLLPTA